MAEKNEAVVAGTEDKESDSGGELFDLIIPPGVPRKIIVQIVNTFDVELVARRERLYFANMDGDEREILVFRGRREVVEQVEKYMQTELKKFIGEM